MWGSSKELCSFCWLGNGVVSFNFVWVSRVPWQVRSLLYSSPGR